jgi:RNA polymerase sigma-70 factor, ECF subfamily
MTLHIYYPGEAVTSLQSDEELVRSVIQGDHRAYQYLLSRYQDSVAKFIWRLIPLPQDREEICQDVFVKAFFNLHKFRFDARFSTWLYRIAWRTALSFLRRKKPPMIVHGDDMDTNQPSLESTSDDQRVRVIIDREISKLKLDERSIITLFHLQEMSVQEISVIVGKPAGTVKSTLHRVRRKLRVRLKELEGLNPEHFRESVA